jgi:Zn-dependent protease
MFGMPIESLLLRMPVILLALTVHEVAHGWTALKLGDPTAEREGRITFNPIAHLDLLGTLMLLTGLFGWAKPVPVNPYNLRKPKRDIMLVSFAGPLSNILMAFGFGIIIRVSIHINPLFYKTTAYGEYQLTFLMLGFMINAGLAFFNLLPFNPLDGSKIVAGFLPDKHIPAYMNATRHALPIIFGLVIFGAFTGNNFLSPVLNPVFKPYMYVMQLIAFGDGRAIW